MITKHECCEKGLEILLRNVRNLEDLSLVENVIEDYQEEFKIDLIKYRIEVTRMRRTYSKLRTYFMSRK